MSNKQWIHTTARMQLLQNAAGHVVAVRQKPAIMWSTEYLLQDHKNTIKFGVKIPLVISRAHQTPLAVLIPYTGVPISTYYMEFLDILKRSSSHMNQARSSVGCI